MTNTNLYSSNIKTPLGDVIAIADNHGLYLLEFTDSAKTQAKINKLKAKLNQDIYSKVNPIIISIKSELGQYFAGNLLEFKTPIHLLGSTFQQQVWNKLKKIPLGTTISYANIAKKIDKPKAYRAVANANGANRLAIIIPCHRVIQANNSLGGYAGGIKRKRWLLDLEKNLNI